MSDPAITAIFRLVWPGFTKRLAARRRWVCVIMAEAQLVFRDIIWLIPIANNED